MDNLDCNKALNGHKDLDKTVKENQIKTTLGSAISETALKKIETILADIAALTILERLFLYLKLPTECSKMSDPLRQPINPLGSRSEISQTIVWIKTHLECNPELSLPKQDVYNQYFDFCHSSKVKPLSTADFGKVMKQVYPEVKPRRLGTRGNSRYCYAGLRRKMKLCAPLLPDLLDKSLETPHIPTELLTSSWEIVREWSEAQLHVNFPSIEALACHLVLEFSVGKGTTAAAIITSSIQEPTDDQSGLLNRFKTQDTQVQVQRRVLKRNDNTRDHKRKMQIATPKIENRTRYKKRKAQSVPVTCDINMSEKSDYGCDKTKGLVCLQNLPDFSNFQKIATNNNGECEYVNRIHKEAIADSNSEFALELSTNGKVPIPRLSTEKVAVAPSKKLATPTKYKVIQPKPELVDAAAPAADALQVHHTLNYVNGSQTACILSDIVDATKLPPKADQTMISIIRNELTNVYNESNVELSRERLISIGNIDKDALDDYLGSNNSQEHEEELTQYFDDKTESLEHQTKLSQLRQLLISKQKSSHVADKIDAADKRSEAFTFPANTTISNQQPVRHLPNFSMLNPRRRVSFDVPFSEEAVPPSPNTRRKNFNFTPISPSSLSPTGGQSKGSSGTTSPFVSPNNTPIPRAKFVNAAKPFERKLKIDQYLTIETTTANPDDKGNLYVSPDLASNTPMSAPVSPRFKRGATKTTSSSNNNYRRCAPYRKTVNAATSQESLSPEITELLANKSLYAGVDASYRSQSVPLRQMYLKGDVGVASSFTPTMPHQLPLDQANCVALFQSEAFYPDAKHVPQTDLLDVVKMDAQGEAAMNALNEQQHNAELFFNERGAATAGRVLPSTNLEGIKYTASSSRSVPGTPIPCSTHEKAYRSYPSTPITNDIFSYNHSQDFLLNGQPIQDSKNAFLGGAELPFDATQDFNAVTTDILIDDSNKCHFTFDGQLPTIDFNAKDNIDGLQETCLVTEDEFNFKNIDFSET